MLLLLLVLSAFYALFCVVALADGVTAGEGVDGGDDEVVLSLFLTLFVTLLVICGGK